MPFIINVLQRMYCDFSAFGGVNAGTAGNPAIAAFEGAVSEAYILLGKVNLPTCIQSHALQSSLFVLYWKIESLLLLLPLPYRMELSRRWQTSRQVSSMLRRPACIPKDSVGATKQSVYRHCECGISRYGAYVMSERSSFMLAAHHFRSMSSV